MMKSLIAAGTATAAVAATILGLALTLGTSAAQSATNNAQTLALIGTALFHSRPHYLPVGTIACRQETLYSYYCYDTNGVRYFVSVANGLATWTAFSESGGELWGSATVAMTAAP
jgi:hypothetical protein